MKSLLKKISRSSIIITGLLLALNTQAFEQDKVLTLPYYNSASFSPQWLTPNSAELKDFHKISDFKWLNQDGEYVTSNTFDNKIYVASFFFTSCPGICPKMRSQLFQVQQTFIDNDNIGIISHSIQPSNDTVEILKEYADNHEIKSGKWHLITGDRDEIYAAARGDYFANEDLGEFVSNNDFLHTENLVLVDSHRHIRGIYNGLNKTSVNHLISDIKVLDQERLKEKQ
jgi:protein SCO1/2